MVTAGVVVIPLGFASLVAVLAGGSRQDWLIATGAGMELAGLVLIASPELVIGLRIASREARRAIALTLRALDRLWGRLRALARRPRDKCLQVEAAGYDAVGGDLAKVVKSSPNKNPLQKIEFLLRENERTQDRLNSLERQAARVPEALRESVEASRVELEELQRDLIEDSEKRHLSERLAGLSVLGVGIALTTAGNLV